MSLKRQVVIVQFLSINFFSWISSIFVGFFKSSRFLCHPVLRKLTAPQTPPPSTPLPTLADLLYLWTSLHHIHCTSYVNVGVLCSASCVCVTTCTCLLRRDMLRSTIAQASVLVSENATLRRPLAWMQTRLLVKCLFYVSDSNQNLTVSTNFSKKFQLWIFIKICPVRIALFHAERRANRLD